MHAGCKKNVSNKKFDVIWIFKNTKDIFCSHRRVRCRLVYLAQKLRSSKLSKCCMVPNAILFYILLPYKSLTFAVEIAFGTNKHLLILILSKVSGDAKQFFYTIRLINIGNEACIRRPFNF